jgi:hypothetical protein
LKSENTYSPGPHSTHDLASTVYQCRNNSKIFLVKASTIK